jgi:hypothetical protein
VRCWAGFRLTGDQEKKLGQTDGLTFLGDPITQKS